mgnify:CR=1 FL=1
MIAVRVSPDPFDTGAEIAALGRDGIGAVASFTGFVRGDGGLVALTLEHYPAMTEASLRALADKAEKRWSLGGVTLHHRPRQGDVAPRDRLDGVRHLGLGQTTHAGDLGGQLVQFVAVGLDRVLVQPKRPVM